VGASVRWEYGGGDEGGVGVEGDDGDEGGIHYL
jgi:hypothetical protein